MFNDVFEINYSNIIEPIYGKKDMKVKINNYQNTC